MRTISKTEKLAFMGMVAYPDMRDREVADLLDLPNSTFASAKARLQDTGLVQEIFVPIYPKLGLELMAVVYSDFNPSVSVDERVMRTKRSVEIYPEMVLSLGESHRGFSISVARNITRIMRISHQRMRTLAEMNLLEIELPIEVMFPFEISEVHRFFNLAPLLFKSFKRMDPELFEGSEISQDDLYRKDALFSSETNEPQIDPEDVDLSRKQLEVLYYIIKYPGMSASKLASVTPYSRHTISRVKDKLMDNGYISFLRVPEISRLNYNILSLFHARIDPKDPLTPEICRRKELLQDDTVFMLSRPTELVMLAAYDDYVEYNRGMSVFNQFLKAGDHLRMIPNIRNHSLSETRWIKRFSYHSLIKDTFDLKVD